MASYIENGLAIRVPNAGIVDFEVAFGTESVNEFPSFAHNLLVGFESACIV